MPRISGSPATNIWQAMPTNLANESIAQLTNSPSQTNSPSIYRRVVTSIQTKFGIFSRNTALNLKNQPKRC